MKLRIFGLENEYGLIFSPNGRIYLPMEKVLGYIFEGLIPNSWPSNAFLVNGARFYQDTGCHPEYSTPECDNILDLVIHDKAGERLLEACLPAAEHRLRFEHVRIYHLSQGGSGRPGPFHDRGWIHRQRDGAGGPGEGDPGDFQGSDAQEEGQAGRWSAGERH